MQDFIRIGGPITSSPLNENFRRLLNAISIANTNLVFPEENSVVNTVTEMYSINDPLDGQVCYVISSGEFYRYSKSDNKWHVIMDIGQTFRQGFLNSGAVVLEKPMELADTTLTKIKMPAMLVYFKNRPGDGRYLKGMYKVEEKVVNITSWIEGAGAYSIFVDYTGTYSIVSGMPAQDDTNHIFIGTFLVNNANKIIQNKLGSTTVGTCLYTLPDIAYTADRGNFMVNGGQAIGMNLTTAGMNTANAGRRPGYYYDEGINYTIGKTDDFPVDTDNGSGFNLKSFDEESPCSYFVYMIPDDGLNKDLVITSTLIYNQYWNGSELKEVPDGHFTIQQHLVTPNGENIIIFGTQIYNSMTDALSNVNETFGINIEFPYVEATRIVLGKAETATEFTTDDANCCKFLTLGRISQVGTISPEFADTAFKLYSGDTADVSPSMVRFDLLDLQNESYEGLYSLDFLPSQVTRELYSDTKKYITDTITTTVTKTKKETRKYNTSTSGYRLADDDDLTYIRNRLKNLETEVWSTNNSNKQRYEQSIRYRLFHAEDRLDTIDLQIADHETRIQYVEKYKVHKNTSVNGYKLGDNTKKDEAKAIVLKTGDIDEGTGLGSNTNLWYTEERVSANSTVVQNTNHRNTKSTGTKDATLSASSVTGHAQVNPHNISTDDLVILQGSQKLFVTPEEERRIRSDRLPDNTKAELNKKLETIGIQTIEGKSTSPGTTTTLGNVTALKFYTSGANITVDSANKVATVECVGQTDPNDFLLRKEFAISATARPDLYGGAVDRALNADNLTALDNATPDQYYGTNSNGDKGVFDLPVYVSTMDASSYTDVDQATFVPIDKSITLRHLADGKVTYTTGNEENELQTNVYDLVKNHYHKVYNSGSQGPYIEGTTTQDTSAIKYEYEATSGGLKAHVYYFTYNNTSYKFTATTAMVAKTLFTYTPSTNALKYTIPGKSAASLTITQVSGETVDNNYWLPFVAKTDWNKINEWNFGNNLTVTVVDGRATINAAVAGNGATSFANLSDTNVTYTEGNVGKIICLGKDSSNNFKLQFMNAPALNNYMLIADYVESTIDKKVKSAANADLATVATSANKLQSKYTVNDSGTSNTVLWTASKIKTNTSAQIKAEGVNTYYGTSAPTTIAGAKDGDLYILIEN